MTASAVGIRDSSADLCASGLAKCSALDVSWRHPRRAFGFLKSAWRLAVDRAVILAGARLFHTRFLLLIRFARTGNGNAHTPPQRLRDRFPRRALHLLAGQCRRPGLAVHLGAYRPAHFGPGLTPFLAQA